MSSFRKRAEFSLEKEHTKEQSKSLLGNTQTDFAFLRRAAETERAVEKEQFFHLRKSRVFSPEKAHTEKSRKVFSETHNRQTLTEEEFCFFQKNVFILVVFTNIKQSLSLLLFAREQQTLFRLHSLRALSLHFEEAFVVVVVSEED